MPGKQSPVDIIWPKRLPKAAEPRGARKECAACGDWKAWSAFPTRDLMRKNGVFVYVCLECIKAHLPETRKPKRTSRKRPSAKCSRATFEGIIEGFPTVEGIAALAWECYRRLTTQQQIKVLEAMNGETDEEDPTPWIMKCFNKAREGA